ncbi:TRAP transporter large permease [Oceanibacterium hippocampi]|uniref:TRAP transporter large permease protein n=1 Tax=Oceanibacterium hippocampi TaxID=745714 RepID=A0A1Y5U5X6_9PROT|nr:TRAP transporter large permease [Oceanibacterium hippocampi]SLN77818.1 Sialic acid TRAP transporter permease protein SiaT [Oceanibacterium hippocampi]
MTLILLIISILVLLAFRLPVALALAVPSAVYVLLGGFSMEIAAQRMFAGVDSFPLLAVPLFMLAGALMNQGGITERIFEFVESALGHIRGSLGYVNISASVVFSGMSGAAVVDAAGLGAIEIKAMKERGYDEKFAVGITAASSTIGPIIPPSIPAVVYAVTAGVSLGSLFIAGVLPGLLMALALAIAVYVYTRFNDVPTSRRESAAFIWKAFVRALPALMAPVIILAGIFAGFFTPTEAGAIAVLYALLVAAVVYRAITWRQLWTVLLQTAEMTAAIMVIVAASAVFSWVLALEQAPQLLSAAVLGTTDSPFVFVLLVIVVLLLVGMVLEPLTAILILVPMLQPLVRAYGLDPVHFGVITILALMIGLLTPPVGLVLYVLHSVSGVSIRTAIQGTLPFLIPLIAALLLIAYVPQISLLLPRYFGF